MIMGLRVHILLVAALIFCGTSLKSQERDINHSSKDKALTTHSSSAVNPGDSLPLAKLPQLPSNNSNHQIHPFSSDSDSYYNYKGLTMMTPGPEVPNKQKEGWVAPQPWLDKLIDYVCCCGCFCDS